MKLIEATLETVSTIVPEALASGEDCAVYCVADAPCAVVGSNGGADLDAIDRLGVRLVQIKHEGGTIVLSPGDVDIGIFTQGYKGDEYRAAIVNRLVTLIREHGRRAEVAGNDVLVDGKKVCGFGSRMFGKTLYTAIHISVGMDLENIKSICTKKMSKIPAGLGGFEVTTEEVVRIVYDVLGDEGRALDEGCMNGKGN